jgi:hypothetical protein
LAASPGGSGLLPLGAAAAFLTLVMYRLGYLDWKGWVASRRRSQSAHFRPALRLGSLTGKNIRWDPPRRSRSITPEFSLTNLFKR